MRDIIISRLETRFIYIPGPIIKREKKYFEELGYEIDDVERVYWDVIEEEYNRFIDNNDHSSLFSHFIFEMGNKYLDVVQKIFDYCLIKNTSFASVIMRDLPNVKCEYANMIQIDDPVLFLVNSENKSHLLRFLDDFPEKHDEFISKTLKNFRSHQYFCLEAYINSVHYNEDLLLQHIKKICPWGVEVKKLLHFKSLMSVLIKNKIDMVWLGQSDFSDNDMREAYFTGLFRLFLYPVQVFDLLKGDLNKIMEYYEDKELNEVTIGEKYVDRYDIWNWLITKNDKIIFRIDVFCQVDLNKILSLAYAYPSHVKFPYEIYRLEWCSNQDVNVAKKIVDLLTDYKGLPNEYLDVIYGVENLFTGTPEDRLMKLVDFCLHAKVCVNILTDDEDKLNRANEMIKFQNNVKYVKNNQGGNYFSEFIKLDSVCDFNDILLCV